MSHPDFVQNEREAAIEVLIAKGVPPYEARRRVTEYAGRPES